ncbi:MAG: hypothetical protein ABI384_02880 [Allobranchiibius sp.]
MAEHAWTSTPPRHSDLRGVVRLDRPAGGIAPHRLPKKALRDPVDPQTDRSEWQPFGVGIAFRGSPRGFLETVRDLTLTTIRTERERIEAESQDRDSNLFYLNEPTLCGPADAQRPLITRALHPDARTHRMTVRPDHLTGPPPDLGDGLVTKEGAVSRQRRIATVAAPSPTDCLPGVSAVYVRASVIGLRPVVRSPVRGHLRSGSSRYEGSEADR